MFRNFPSRMLRSSGRHPPQEFLLQLHFVCHAHSLRVPPDRCTKEAVSSGFLRRVPSPHASRVSEKTSIGQPRPPVKEVLCSLPTTQYAHHYTGLILQQLGCNTL